MTIKLDNVGKRFNKEWIFKRVNLRLTKGKSYAITGHNGSGKSTLLKIISGSLLQSEGSIIYQDTSKEIPPEYFYKYISLVAPYLKVLEEFTLQEFLNFHFKFKSLREGIQLKDLPEIFQLPHAKNKLIKNFSTGMTQRLKLGISFYSDVPIILLDEPATNLDKTGVQWYHDLVEQFKEQSLLIVSSNRQDEYSFCDEMISIMDYK